MLGRGHPGSSRVCCTGLHAGRHPGRARVATSIGVQRCGARCVVLDRSASWVVQAAVESNDKKRFEMKTEESKARLGVQKPRPSWASRQHLYKGFATQR